MLSNTRCPVCASTFAIAPEILAAAGGWVRCGRCANVFDAGAHRPENPSLGPLQTATVSAKPNSPPAPNLVLPSPGVQMPTATGGLAFNAEVIDPAQSERRLKRVIGKLNRSIDRVLEGAARSDAATEIEPKHSSEQPEANPESDLPHATDGLGQGGANPMIERRTIKRPATESVTAGSETSPVVDPEPAKGALMGRWASGASQVTVRRTALVGLLLTLGLQLIMAYRIEAATHYPGFKAALEGLCAPLGCEVPLIAAPDSLSVESTEFQLLDTPNAGISYQFSWHVRNLAVYPVKAPALELSLTDALDRPILRKVLLPAELGLTSEAIDAEGHWVGELPVRVTIPAGAPAIAGYRVTAFYP